MVSAIVMAAGKGTRMKSEHAKTMQKVLDKPMIEHVVDTLDKLSVDKKVIIVGYDGDTIKAHLKERALYAVQEPQRGTGHAVMQAECLKNEKGKTLIINGDCPLIKKETYEKMLAACQDAPLVLLTTVLQDAKSYGRIIRSENGDVLAIVEAKDCNADQKQIREINAGIYCVDNELLWKYLPQLTDDNAQKEYYITDLVKLFVRDGLRVVAIIGDQEELQGINSRSELVMANRYLQRIVNQKHMDNGVTLVDPDSIYISTETVIGADTIIYPNVRIEGKCVIGSDNIIDSNSYFRDVVIGNNNQFLSTRITDSTVKDGNKIGPDAHFRNNTQIGSNCRIGNYVEMKNVTFGNGSKCAHLTYLGDTKVGEACNFGCGVVTVNYDGKNKFHTEIGNHVFVGSNVNLIAPVTIKDYSVLAAGTTVTQDVLEGDMAIGRVRQENKAGYGKKYLSK